MNDTGHFPRPLVGPAMRRMPRMALGFAIALAAFTGPLSGLKAGEATSAEKRVQAPLLPGVDADDSRGRLDPEKGPGALSASFRWPRSTVAKLAPEL
jgi:hypothetical protein